MKFKATIFTFLLCLILPSMSFGQYSIGDSVNDFTLNDIDGKSVSLSDFDGQVVLFNFFATW